jgi:putative colanic acid biosynthesis acetyltransferase WcaF
MTQSPSQPAAETQRLRSSQPLRVKLGRLCWAAVEATLFRYSFHTMYGFRRALLRMFGAQVGPQARVRRTVRVYYPWNLTLGELAIVGDDARIYNLARITLGPRAMVSQEAYLCAGTHDYTTLALPLVTMPIVVEADAWVCARAFIGPGVTVGAGAVVAAGAVVPRDVPAWMIVGGNPAKMIKKRPVNDSGPAGKDV